MPRVLSGSEFDSLFFRLVAVNDTLNNSPEPHVIRLRGPSQFSWLRNGTQLAVVRVQIPCQIGPELFDSGETEREDQYILTRSFQKPTGLEPSQSVTLELEGFEGLRQLRINRGSSTELASDCVSDGAASLVITNHLQAVNRIELTFRPAPSVAGELRLKIQ